MTLQHFQQPVMNVGTRQNPTYLPPEVCVILPGQSSLSKLEPDQTAQMIRFAVRRPNENASSIVSEGAETIGIGQAANTKLVCSTDAYDHHTVKCLSSAATIWHFYHGKNDYRSWSYVGATRGQVCEK